MKLSVITPCYNMERYIARTINSVSGPDNCVEHIVVDGGSSDGTMDIVREHISGIAKVISEKDNGQYHAIAKGMACATGDIQCWINADDILMQWTVSVVLEVFEKFPDVQWITGMPSFLNENGQLVQCQANMASYPQNDIAAGRYSKKYAGYLQQESMFWRRSLWEKAGGLNLDYTLAADFDLWTRFAKIAPLVPVAIPLAAFRERAGVQRSSQFAHLYEAEVANCIAELPQAGWIWRKISGLGVVAQNLARLLIWRKTDAILFARKRSEWLKISSWRSVSRVSLGFLVQEYILGRQK